MLLLGDRITLLQHSLAMSYDPSKPAPLLISLHPAGTWPAVEMHISRWNELADQHGFLLVYPEGSGVFFGGLAQGRRCGPRTRILWLETSRLFLL
jgi:hypothetical protein